MGAFDDLIPQGTPSRQGAFDDLVPSGGFNQRAGSFASGANAELAKIAGGVFDLSAWLGNKAVGGINTLAGREVIAPVTKPWLGSENIQKGITSVVGETVPRDEIDRLLYGAGAGTAGAVTGMGVGGALSAAGRAPNLARTLMGGEPSLPTATLNSAIGAGWCRLDGWRRHRPMGRRRAYGAVSRQHGRRPSGRWCDRRGADHPRQCL